MSYGVTKISYSLLIFMFVEVENVLVLDLYSISTTILLGTIASDIYFVFQFALYKPYG